MTAETAGGERPVPGARPRAAAAAGEHEINPLQRLIRQRLAERGWSYGEVARRGGLPRSTVYALATTRNLARPPRPATIDALARGLDVPVSAVRAAAAESTGLHYYGEPSARSQDPADRERELLIASIDELTPEERRHVAALVESLRNRASRGADGRLAPPRSPPRAPRAWRNAGSGYPGADPLTDQPASGGHGRKVADPSGARRQAPPSASAVMASPYRMR
jgi:transcriptional regulator with XRE-family HTH domain